MILSEPAFTATYTPRSSDDAVTALHQFRAFEASDEFYTYFARDEEVPIERVRNWEEGTHPEFIPGIEIATERG